MIIVVTTTHTFLIESQSVKMLNDVHKVNFPNGKKDREWTRPSSVPSRVLPPVWVWVGGTPQSGGQGCGINKKIR